MIIIPFFKIGKEITINFSNIKEHLTEQKNEEDIMNAKFMMLPDESAYPLDVLFINAKVNKNNYASYNSIDEYIKKLY